MKLVLVLSACLLSSAHAVAPRRAASLLARGEQLRKSREQSKTMSALYPFYHTTEEIRTELRSIAQKCSYMSLQTQANNVGDDSRSIDVVTIKKPDATPVNKNFLLFGEHSRELISAESGLHLVRALCGENEGLKQRAEEVLKDSEFQIVVNGNPGSRSKVEQGSFCLRVDPDGVDLNRNWDEEWQPGAVLDAKDTNPGPQPFSEPETQTFKKLVEEYRPTTFLTVHSGTKGMYMPWAYDMEHLATRNQPQMMKILRDLDKDHCECPFGAAGREVGYSCPGTCLDWVYDKLSTQYAFAFEIYVGSDYAALLKERWQEKMQNGVGAFYQTHSHLGHSHFKDLFEKHPSCFVQVAAERHRNIFERSEEDCFAQFNPSEEEEYKGVVDNWTRAYFDMAMKVAANLKSTSPGANVTAGGMAFADV